MRFRANDAQGKKYRRMILLLEIFLLVMAMTIRNRVTWSFSLFHRILLFVIHVHTITILAHTIWYLLHHVYTLGAWRTCVRACVRAGMRACGRAYVHT